MRRFLLVPALALMLSAGGACSSSSPPPAASNYTPQLINSQVAPGAETRFLVSLLDGQRVVASDTIPVHLAFFDSPSGTKPVAESDTTFALSNPELKLGGLYIGHVTFTRAGTWAVDITYTKPGAKPVTQRVTFTVVEKLEYPGPGTPAPHSQTKTIFDVGGDITKISTDPNPDPALYQDSIAGALDKHVPFVVVFATPKFCTSRVCGPTVDLVKQAHKQFASVEVIHVEVVDPTDAVDAANNLKYLPVVTEWGLPSEPWVFVVGRDGKVAAAYEGFVTEAELTAAVRTVTF